MLYASIMSPIDIFIGLCAALFVWRCWTNSVPQNDQQRTGGSNTVAVSPFFKKNKMPLTEQQIDMLVDMYGLEWVDYIEYVNEGKEE